MDVSSDIQCLTARACGEPTVDCKQRAAQLAGTAACSKAVRQCSIPGWYFKNCSTLFFAVFALYVRHQASEMVLFTLDGRILRQLTFDSKGLWCLLKDLIDLHLHLQSMTSLPARLRSPLQSCGCQKVVGLRHRPVAAAQPGYDRLFAAFWVALVGHRS